MKLRNGAQKFKLLRRIPSRLDEVDGVCREIRTVLQNHGLESASFAIELVARECLNNAVIHGNSGLAGKSILLGLNCARRWMSLQVTDEGDGFNWRRFCGQPLKDSDVTSGRGLFLITAYADRVRFNRKGNQITLWLRKEAESTTT
jgi:serine/threonine-protein kinase RsbW